MKSAFIYILSVVAFIYGCFFAPHEHMMEWVIESYCFVIMGFLIDLRNTLEEIKKQLKEKENDIHN